MRIEVFQSLIAVVWLTALMWPRLAANNVTGKSNCKHELFWEMRYREIQMILEKESSGPVEAVDCCPTQQEFTQPIGGKNRNDEYVHLFRSDDIEPQTFYEYSCRNDVIDKPCRFAHHKIYNQSRCVQKYSYSYAMVKKWNHDDSTHSKRHQKSSLQWNNSIWSLDYIQIKSGCSCEITPNSKTKSSNMNKRKKKSKRKKIKKNTPKLRSIIID